MTEPLVDSKPIGVGIVGLSASRGWAAASHFPALASLDGYELRALSTSSAESAQAAGHKYGVELTFGSAEQLAESPEVDLVIIAVKAPLHRQTIVAAINAGKMVFSEWPLGINLTETEELAALARSRNVRTAIGLQARSSPLLRYLRDLVAQGYLGRMLSTTLVSSHNAWADALKIGPYILDEANGANLLTVGFGHTVDAVTMVLGEFIEVTATSRNLLPTYRDTTTGQVITKNTDDHIAVTGVLESGAVANVLVRGGVSRATDFRWEINGTDGDLVVTSHGSSWNRRLTLVGRQGSQNEFVALPVPARYEQRVPQFAGRSNETAYNIAYAYAQLRDDITEGTNVVPDFDHAVRRHRLIDAVERAAETGQRQTVALTA
ncbi:MAG: oxidoreductase domain protein [Mycobacterium sp.]|nr:oxidoreductase domain protein [Mycobacterium sp.]